MGFDDKIGHSFGFKGCASLNSPHIKFLKEKKRKKRKSSLKWRFQEKQVFSRKYYPGFYDKVVRNWSFDSSKMLKRNENEGGDFIENRRLELSFLETGAYLYFLFIYFFIFLLTERFLSKTD